MMKDFDVPPVLTQKDENVPCGGLFAHNLAYQFGKGENTFSHIYRTFAQVEAHAGIQPNIMFPGFEAELLCSQD